MTTLTIRPGSLRCEYLNNPLGLDAAPPRLSWQLCSPRRGVVQSAYQIRADEWPERLAGEQPVLWDSGKIVSDQQAQIAYAGPALRSGHRVYWSVRVWDGAGEVSPWSEPAWWEMGLLDRADWRGRWIGSSTAGGRRTSPPCPYLRKGFRLDPPEAPVASARLYITALGLYEAYLNGRRVGVDQLTPGWTDYRHRVQYQAYDVAELLKPGHNALGAILGDGWYCGCMNNEMRQICGDHPRLLAQLVVQLADGSTHTVVSDESWTTTTGPLLGSDLQQGETHDARLELPGWSEAGHDDASWQAVRTFDDPGIALVAQAGPPVRVTQELAPVGAPVRYTGARRQARIYDFGQNLVGRVRLKVRGRAGAMLMLRHAEMLDKDGRLYTTNLRTAAQTDSYTLRGSGAEEIFEPRFTFHGFRYLEVSEVPLPATEAPPATPPAPLEVHATAIVLHSDIPLAGEFACDQPLVNQLYRNIHWGQRGNFVDVPTDCPQRDERMGWTGDAQVFIRTATYNNDVAGFFSKWLEDLMLAQAEDGGFNDYAPNYRYQRDAGPAWSDAGIICPWAMHLVYGERRILERHYDRLVKHVEGMRAKSLDLIRAHPANTRWQGYGDWLSINADTPKDLIGTAFFAHGADLLARIAGVLGRAGDQRKHEQLAAQVRQAFQRRFVTPEGLVLGHTQTAYVLALHFDLLPEAQRRPALAALVEDIRRRGTHLSTGFVGAGYLLHVLSRFGQDELAEELLLQQTFPSWLYPVTQGATTIWERWDGWTRDKGFQDPAMNSFNHYAYGAVGDWLLARLAGIDTDPQRVAYEHVLLRPTPGKTIRQVRGAYESIRGRIESDWRVEANVFRWKIELPPNTTAMAVFPAGCDEPSEAEGVEGATQLDGRWTVELGSGRYEFTAALRAAAAKE